VIKLHSKSDFYNNPPFLDGPLQQEKKSPNTTKLRLRIEKGYIEENNYAVCLFAFLRNLHQIVNSIFIQVYLVLANQQKKIIQVQFNINKRERR
jgi:hypothetical protein